MNLISVIVELRNQTNSTKLVCHGHDRIGAVWIGNA